MAHLTRIVMSISILNLVLGCKSPQSSESVTLNSSNSNDICADIETHTRAKIAENPEQNGIRVFESKKEQEIAILNDLIISYHLASIQPQNSDEKMEAYTPTTAEKNLVRADRVCNDTIKGQIVGPPAHYKDLNKKDEFENAIRYYCTQRSKLGDKCFFSRSDSAMCASIGANRPQWITDTCQVNEKLMSKTITQLALEGCGLLASGVFKTEAMNKNCEAPILQTICFSHFSAGKDLVSHLNTYGEGRDINDIAIDRISATFRLALSQCIGSITHRKLISVLKGASIGNFTPAQNAAKFILDKNTAYNAINDIQETPKTKSLGRQVTKQMALTLCSATAQTLAASIDAAPTKVYNDACGERTSAEQRARTASCLRTSADICQSATGIVDFAGIYAEYDQKSKPGVALSSALEFASLSAGQICSIGGDTSSLACGAISSATKEIIRTLRDGNNSWAECLGTSKAGACAGQRFTEWLTGMTVRSSESPITSPERFDGDEVRACCQCQKVYYSDGWLKDTKFRRDSLLMGVTSIIDGGIDQTSCTFYDKKPIQYVEGAKRKGENVYFQYENCRQVILKNFPSCQSPESRFGSPIPKSSIDGVPITGRDSHFGPAKVHVGTQVCLENDC